MLNKLFSYVDILYHDIKFTQAMSFERIVMTLQFVGIGCLSFVLLISLIYGIYTIGDKLTAYIQNNCMFVIYDKCREINLSRNEFDTQNNNIRKFMKILCNTIYLLQSIIMGCIVWYCSIHLSFVLALGVAVLPVFIIYVTVFGVLQCSYDIKH